MEPFIFYHESNFYKRAIYKSINLSLKYLFYKDENIKFTKKYLINFVQ